MKIYLNYYIRKYLNFFLILLAISNIATPSITKAAIVECNNALISGKGAVASKIKARLDKFFDRYPTIRADNYQELNDLFTKEVLIHLLQEIVEDPESLARIARRSYAHSLGFNKIILIEDWKQHFFEENVPPGKHGYDIRLHIWWPKRAQEKSIATAESKHEHKWDFTSRIITGGFENHRYLIRNLINEELAIFLKFEAAMRVFPKEKVKEICDRIDMLEVADLNLVSRMSELSGGADFLRKKANEPDLRRILGLSKKEFKVARNILVKYTNQIRQLTGEEAYRSVGPFLFELQNVETYRAGDLYFHPIEHAHRLFVQPIDFTSTFIIVGPPYKNHDPGQFVHSGAGRDDSEVQSRQFYTPDSLKAELKSYLKALEAIKQ